MLTSQHIEEALSLAYVQAIAGRAGVNLSTRRHDYGIDGSFHEVHIVHGRRVESGFTLDWQLKASIHYDINDSSILCNIEAKTYNDLIIRASSERATPCILIVLHLPEDAAMWMEFSEEQLLLRKCCYWHYLKGELTSNSQTKRITIPRAQQLTPEAVLRLLDHVKRGELQ